MKYWNNSRYKRGIFANCSGSSHRYYSRLLLSNFDKDNPGFHITQFATVLLSLTGSLFLLNRTLNQYFQSNWTQNNFGNLIL